MARQKLLQLMEALRQATIEGRVHWSVAIDVLRYQVPLGPAVMEIEEESFGAKSFSYTVYIKSPSGDTLEVEFFEPDGANSESFSLAKDLYELARKDTLRLDDLLDSMITDVRSAKK